ncbi:MAG TPA: SAM-dependent methyltransferase [Bacteroidota bacterium]|nr:SAM-dependent methyltransferase [Bacteroidota bacterium]
MMPDDDRWGPIVSEIRLAVGVPSASLAGIEKFSHLDILYVFHKVRGDDTKFSARPRGNPGYPRMGIFAQRKKERPNGVGLSTVRLLAHRGRTIVVRYLDAIDGTPVIDIKPVLTEFLPKGRIRQPKWSHAIMKRYWNDASG